MKSTESVKLGSICRIMMGQSPASETYNTDGVGLPFFQGNADFGEEHPVPTKWCSKPKKTAGRGDILISVRAPIGAINTASEECCIGRGVAALRPDAEEVNAAYLKYYLISKRRYLESIGTGSTFTAIGKSALSDLCIKLYDLDTQVEISHRIDKVSDSIRFSTRLLSLLEDLVKSRFIEMFEGESFPTFKLMDLCDKITKGTTPTTAGYSYTQTGVNFIKVESLDSGGKLIPGKISHISLACNNALNRSQLEEGDLLYSIAGAIGRCAIVPAEILPANTNQAFAIIRLNCDAPIERTYLKEALSSTAVVEEVEKSKRGIAQTNLSLRDIRSLETPVPPYALQVQFTRFVSSIDKLRFDVQEQIRKLETLKQSLMQKYFG